MYYSGIHGMRLYIIYTKWISSMCKCRNPFTFDKKNQLKLMLHKEIWCLAVQLFDWTTLTESKSAVSVMKEYVTITDVMDPSLPRKHAITCINWDKTGPMPVALARFWPSKGTLWHVYGVFALCVAFRCAVLQPAPTHLHTITKYLEYI